MKINRILNLLGILLIFFYGFSVDARVKNTVWHNPEGTQNIETYFPGLRVNVSNVEFNHDSTTISLHIKTLRPNMTCQIPSSTILMADGKEYALSSVDGKKMDVMFNPSLYSGDSIALHFDPLPAGCGSFDLLMGERPVDVKVTGIRPLSTRLDESCWRDDSTGDWIIGFFPEGIVYDNRVWTYVSRDDQSGKFVVTDGKDNMAIKAGKEKNGQRKIKIGEQPAVSLGRIIGNTLPAYPDKEYKGAFDNSKYLKEDSVTISGWVRGLPEVVTQHRGKDIKVYYHSVFTGSQEKVSTDMDSTGYFSLTFPVPNTTHIMLDTKSNTISFPVEPGKEYFVLEDYAGQKRLVMGDDVRVQNEIVSFGFPFISPRADETDGDYTDTVNRWQSDIDKAIGDIAKNNPTLSDLCIDYLRNNAMMEMASAIFQGRMRYPNGIIPPHIVTYVRDKYWKNLPENVNAYSEYAPIFINSYIENAYLNDYSLPFKSEDGRSMFLTIPYDLAGTLSDDIALVRNSVNGVDSIEADSARQAFDRVSRSVQSFLEENGQDYWNLTGLKAYQTILSEIETTPEITDIFMSSFFDGIIKSTISPLSDKLEAQIDSVFTGQVFKDYVRQNNDRYKSLISHANQSGIDIKKGDDMKNIWEGEALFNIIVGPYKGRPVLIDVWGTWCGPCREAMKDFAKERDALAPYDVVFVFLANNSKDEVIKAVINEYGIQGENVVHYNLPADRQQELERFLKVSGYPSYRLVGPDGNLIDANVDARNLDTLIKLLKLYSHD